MHVPFNRPYVTGVELDYVREAIANHHLSGDGPFTKRCHEWIRQRLGCGTALLTHSCTAALEMAAILADVGPGDEVIMPSYTFVSTANAFVLRGAVPVFVDIRNDTLNLDENLIEAAITSRTKAIAPVHYAGVGCDMDRIMEIANHRKLVVIEDAAQGLLSSYQGRPLGTFGQLSAISFHETKNVIAGEGGALVVNDEAFAHRAEVIREKGTNRTQFRRGEVDKYTWVDIGSSYLPSEIVAAFLWAQLEQADALTDWRREIWTRYHEAFADLEKKDRVRRPVVPSETLHNGHLYYLLMPNAAQRTQALQALAERDINAVFHYVPLHSSPAGRKYGRAAGDLVMTDDLASRLLRLPLYPGMTTEEQHRVIEAVHSL